MPDCTQCAHYHKERSYLQSMIENSGSSASNLGGAYSRIYNKEQRDRERENLAVQAAVMERRSPFKTKPKIVAFCSFGGECHVPCVKNPPAGKPCEVDEPVIVKRPQRCLDCQHCVRPTGDQLAVLTKLLEGYLRMRVGSNDPAPLKSVEFEAAYDSGGLLPWPTPPQFLAYCRNFSKERERLYSICAFQNPAHDCAAWRPLASGGDQSGLNGHVFDEIVLILGDDWRCCGEAVYFRLSSESLYLKEFASGRWMIREYLLTEAPRDLFFNLLDSAGVPRNVWVKWSTNKAIVRSGLRPREGMFALPVHLRFKRFVNLTENSSNGRPKTYAIHPNVEQPYAITLFAGKVRIEGKGVRKEMHISEISKGVWMRPSEDRFGQPLPLRLRRATPATALGQWLPEKDDLLRSALNLWDLGVLEVEWLDD